MHHRAGSGTRAGSELLLESGRVRRGAGARGFGRLELVASVGLISVLSLFALRSGPHTAQGVPDQASEPPTSLYDRVVELRTILRGGDAQAAAEAGASIRELLLELEPTFELALSEQAASPGSEPPPESEPDPESIDRVRAYVAAAGELMAVWPQGLPPGRTAADQCALALDIARTGGQADTIAYLGNQLGQIHTSEARFDEARAVYQRTLDEHPNAWKRVPTIRLNLAGLHLREGDFASAESEIEAAANDVDSIPGDFPYKGHIRCNVLHQQASLALQIGRPDQAADMIRAQRELAEAIADPWAIGFALINEANLLLSQRRTDRLRAHVESALELDFMPTLPLVQTELHLARGLSYVSGWNLAPELIDLARGDFERVLANPQSDDQKRLEARAWLAEMSLQAGELETAQAHLVEAAVLTGRLGSHQGKGPVESAAFVAAMNSDLLIRRGAEPEVLTASLTELEAAYERLLAMWSSIPPREGGIGFLLYKNRRRVISQLIQLNLEVHGNVEGARRGFAQLNRAHAMGSNARAAGYSPKGLEQIRAALIGPDSGALIFLCAPDASHLFTLDAGSLAHHTLPSQHLLDAQREDVNREVFAAMRSGTEADLDRNEQARAFADILLPEPVLAKLAGWQSTSVVGLDTLGYVPFELLARARGETGPSTSIAWLPSLPVGMLLAEREQPDAAKLDLWLLAAPALSEAMPEAERRALALPWSDSIRQQLTAGFDADRVRVSTGQAASLATLREAELGQAGMLHILAHGIEDPASERGPGVQLAPSEGHDGRVFQDDLRELELPPIVLLSACGGADGTFRKGEDTLFAVASALLEAGAQTVLLSRGQLELQAAVRFAAELQAGLRQGLRPSVAARNARRRMLADQRSDHPSYWLIHTVGLDRPYEAGRAR